MLSQTNNGAPIPPEEIPKLADTKADAAVHDTVGALETEIKRVLQSHGNAEGEPCGRGSPSPTSRSASEA
jgi:hypothetical protein